MTSHDELTTPTGNHLLHLYRDLPSLAANVGAYLEEGARQGDRLIVVARPAHREAFREELAARGIDVTGLRADGRLTLLDAEATLARFMVDGRPDAARFDDVIGGFVRAELARAGARELRAYGEMVDLLWAAGQAEAAVELEGLWNRLLELERFRLFCAYGIDLLAPGTSPAMLRPLFGSHTHLIPGRSSDGLQKVVDQAMRETLGAEAVDALLPLIQASQHAPAVHPGPEATLLWLRRHLPASAERVLSRARALHEEERS